VEELSLDFLNADSFLGFLSGIAPFIFSFLLVIPALTMHEWAHGWMANRLGDPTARMMGRISINPLRHIDPIGTVIFPIAMVLLTGLAFGWAKPVPFNPRYLKNPKRDTALIALAGPAMNVLLALGSALILIILRLTAPQLIFNYAATDSGMGAMQMISSLTGLGFVLAFFCYINLILCFFNLLPIPPFDGSRVVMKYLTGNARHWYGQLENYGMFIVAALIFIPPMLFGFNLVGMYFAVTTQPLLFLMTGIPAGLIFEFLATIRLF